MVEPHLEFDKGISRSGMYHDLRKEELVVDISGGFAKGKTALAFTIGKYLESLGATVEINSESRMESMKPAEDWTGRKVFIRDVMFKRDDSKRTLLEAIDLLKKKVTDQQQLISDLTELPE